MKWDCEGFDFTLGPLFFQNLLDLPCWARAGMSRAPLQPVLHSSSCLLATPLLGEHPVPPHKVSAGKTSPGRSLGMCVFPVSHSKSAGQVWKSWWLPVSSAPAHHRACFFIVSSFMRKSWNACSFKESWWSPPRNRLTSRFTQRTNRLIGVFWKISSSSAVLREGKSTGFSVCSPKFKFKCIHLLRGPGPATDFELQSLLAVSLPRVIHVPATVRRQKPASCFLLLPKSRWPVRRKRLWLRDVTLTLSQPSCGTSDHRLPVFTASPLWAPWADPVSVFQLL